VRDYTPIEAVIAAVQERYARRRRRMPYVLLQRLWQDDRALPCTKVGDDDVEDVMLPLFDLNPDLFQTSMEFV